MNVKTKDTFGSVIRAIREKRGLSLRGAAEIMEISRTYLSDIETDKCSAPVGEKLERIFKTYKINPEEAYYIMELIGFSREEVAPDMAEYLKKNSLAREVVRRLMKIDLDSYALDHEDEIVELLEKIDSITDKKN